MKFKELLEVQSSRSDSKEMWDYLIYELKQLPDCLVQVEEVEDKIKGVMKNIFVTKGNAESYPTYVSHTDTVHAFHEDVKAFCRDNLWYCLNFTHNSVEQVGTGGDDKVGIWACYQMLKHLPFCKAIFFAFEESGCNGSGASEFVTEFTKDSRYLIQVDRQGNSGIVCTGSGTNIASKQFEEAIGNEGKAFGYAPIHTGGMTDVVTLHKNKQINVSAVNLECGYYKPHTKQEVINALDVERVVQFCFQIGMTLKDVYPHKAPTPVYNNNVRDTRRFYPDNEKKVQTEVEKKEIISSTTSSTSLGYRCYECGEPSLEPFHIECIEKNTNIKVECLGCKKKMTINEHYCGDCEVCETCGRLLLTSEELDLGMCMGCIQDNFGKCQKCQSPLNTIDEIKEGVCNKHYEDRSI